MKRKTGMALALTAVMMAGGMAWAGSHGGGKKVQAKGPIAERQQVMKDIKNSFVPLVKMVKGAQLFDAAVVKKNAETIAAKLEAAAKLFPEGSDKGDTRAKPEIWLMQDEFQAIMKTAVEKAKAVASVSSPDQLAPAVMALGGKGCKACHEKFRLPKKKM